MRDLQHRLSALGFDTSADDPGTFGPATATAVRAFQKARGLRSSVRGACDQTTWEAIVEASWRLGDRPLYLATPMLRGDDVADLQRRLGAVGFDAGRVDGIFGPVTDRALADFQRNAGLVTDAICGPATIGALARLGDRLQAPFSVGDVRERERYRCGSHSLAGRLVVLGHDGGLDQLATSAVRGVAATGATALVLQHPDDSEQARQANAMEAEVFIALAIADDVHGARVSYYRSPAGWESPGGRLLARLFHEALTPVVTPDESHLAAMTVPILRETRMPAVLIELGPPGAVVTHTAPLAATIPDVLQRWVARFANGD